MPLANSPHGRVGQKNIEFVSLHTVAVHQSFQRLFLFFGWRTEFQVVSIAHGTVPRNQSNNP